MKSAANSKTIMANRWLKRTVVALAAILCVSAVCWEDVVRCHWVAELSAQGNPPPKPEVYSPTGYSRHQRYFLGAQLRGETFRWIVDAEGGSVPTQPAGDESEGDDVPRAMQHRAPSLYAGALNAIAWGGNLFWRLPHGIAVERAALVMPLVLQGLLLAVLVVVVALGFGAEVGGLFGGLALLAPVVSNQLLPGVLEPRGAAVMLGAGALLAALVTLGGDNRAARFPRLWIAFSAILGFVALWLDPAVGVPVILLILGARLAAIFLKGDRRELPWLWWAGVGVALTLVGCYCDRAVIGLKAAELRSIHPLYAAMWLGAGWLLYVAERMRRPNSSRWVAMLNLVVAGGLLGVPFYVQIARALSGWFFPAFTIERLTALESTPAATNFLTWWSATGALQLVAVVGLIVFACGWGAFAGVRELRAKSGGAELLAFALALAIGATIYGAFRIRWLVVAELLAFLVGALAWKRCRAGTGVGLRFGGYAAWAALFAIAGLSRLDSIRMARAESIGWGDLQALVYRDLAQWLVRHAPPGSVGILAPPDMTDSMEYHGNFRGLISTAPDEGNRALVASRILGAVLPEEAEALMKRRHITYLALPSWDQVLSRLVRTPEQQRKFALLPRLERWAPPRILKPIPYQIPPVKGMEGQQIALYRVVDPEDEALALSHLAEYFAEMGMEHLAKAAARILGQSFPRDPNAAIARALVFNAAHETADFEKEVPQVIAAPVDGDGALDWDRQVARATVLALANRPKEAAEAVANCLQTASEARLYSLTPLEVFRLNVLARRYRLSYPTPALASLSTTLSDQLVEAGDRTAMETPSGSER